jgi:XTP/dITP diphosphohydrolase
MPPIVIATGNPHKVEELRAILGAKGIDAIGLTDLAGGPFAEPREGGSTFAENAAIKAIAYARATGRPCLADDSGLEVDAIGGRPGVVSSHFSTGGVETGLARADRDRSNNARLLRDLEGVPEHARAARFVCQMCLAAPDGRILATSRGVVEGRIGLAGRVPRGEGGFGYDPLFELAPDFRRTAAELSPAEKNRLSHRARAAEALAAVIREQGLLD